MYTVTIYDDHDPILVEEFDTKKEAEEFKERIWIEVEKDD